MASGVEVEKRCAEEFENLKMKHKHRYIIYRLTENYDSIVVCKCAPPSATYEEFLAEMSECEENKQCRYAVFDFPYTYRDQQKSKVVFIAWSPDSSFVKQKMVYAASTAKLRTELGSGMAVVVQANDQSDLDKESIEKKVLASER